MKLPRFVRPFKAFRLLLAGDCEVLWHRPQPVEVVIWDEIGSQYILDALNSPSHHIIKIRKHAIYVHPLIIWQTLISAFTRRNTHYGIVIKHSRPKTVVTLIDNNPSFHKLASSLPDVRFVAIQNGRRRVFPDEEPAIGLPARYDSEYLCFGQEEIDYFHAMGYQFKQIKVTGSLRNALFDQHLRDPAKGSHAIERRDIVLISQFRPDVMAPNMDQALIEYVEIVVLLDRYLKLHPGLRVSVALITSGDHPDHDAEILFHQQMLGKVVCLIPMSENSLSSYLAAEGSNVVLTASSTLGIEHLSRGRKALVGDSRLMHGFVDHLFAPDWILPSSDQEIFDDFMTKILDMPLKDFVSKNSQSINYFMVAPHENSLPEIKTHVLG